MGYVRVTPLAVTKQDEYTYHSADPVEAGRVVEISLAGRKTLGVARGPAPAFRGARNLRATPIKLTWQLEAAQWLASNYAAPIGLALKQMIFLAVLRYLPDRLPRPTAGGRASRPTIATDTLRWDDYLTRAKRTLATKKSVLWLIPELSMTPALRRRLAEQLPKAVFYHSRLTPKQRAAIWWQVAKGPVVVLGTRSALWLPWNQLGLIVVDEEDDLSYKEDHAPAYHARAAAVRLSHLTGARLVFGNVAPSLELMRLVSEGSAEVSGRPSPVPVRIADMARQSEVIGYQVWQAAAGAAVGGKVAWLFTPKRLRDRVAREAAKIPGAMVGQAGVTADSQPNIVIGGNELCYLAPRPIVIGAIGVDGLLQSADFRGAERVAGTLRRLSAHLETGGQLVVQTEQPDHPALVGLSGTWRQFAHRELTERKALKLPPFERLSRLVYPDEATATQTTTRLVKATLDASASPLPDGRWQVLIKGDPAGLPALVGRHQAIDVDPVTVL